MAIVKPGLVRVSEDGLVERLLRLPKGCRRLVALAGAPASGKSTAAAAVVAALNRHRPDCAVCLQMDGYHLGNSILRMMGRLRRKGAPDTFDAAGLAHMLERIRGPNAEDVFIPVFDRSLDAACAAAAVIPAAADIIIVEGNYLLVTKPPWRGLRQYFDITVMISASEGLRTARLRNRWESQGMTPDEVAEKVQGNDLPNGRFVHEHSADADFVLIQPELRGSGESTV